MKQIIISILKTIFKIIKAVLCVAGVMAVILIVTAFKDAVMDKSNENTENTGQTEIEISGDFSNLEKQLENKLSDKEYYSTIQEAYKHSRITLGDKELGLEYEKRMDHVLADFRNRDYVVIRFLVYDGERMCETFMKFKTKEVNGKKKYAAISASQTYDKKGGHYSSTLYHTIETELWATDFIQDLSITDGKFAYGEIENHRLKQGEDIRAFRVEKQKPNGIIEHKHYGRREYFWYFMDLQSNKPGKDLDYELKGQGNE